MRRPLAIITSYFAGEHYGILGPQLAASLISARTSFDAIVIALTRDYDPEHVIRQVFAATDDPHPVVAFSTLSGRPDLFALAERLKAGGAVTILAGPQAGVDFLGEVDRNRFAHRFQGLSAFFCFALQGPAEQGVDFLLALEGEAWQTIDGLYYEDREGHIHRNPSRNWRQADFSPVNWDNLYTTGSHGLLRLKIRTAQVLQQIGCPHASHARQHALDFPTALSQSHTQPIDIAVKGCSFCDVAADKGFCGALTLESVIDQIKGLPDDAAGKKIPFELINENPLFELPGLLRSLRKKKIRISQINLIMRADWFVQGERRIREALMLAVEMDIRIMMASMGFESFDDRLLDHFNKGVTVRNNLEAIGIMRQLKKEFPRHWKYRRDEGAIHGFIHPTPWDTPDSMANIHKAISLYGLNGDILPAHSTPLIIHHASPLGDWIRKVEEKSGVRYPRYGSVIGWWDDGQDA